MLNPAIAGFFFLVGNFALPNGPEAVISAITNSKTTDHV